MNGMLTVQQAAEYLQISPYTIREKARSGELKAKKVCNKWRTTEEWLLQFAKAI